MARIDGLTKRGKNFGNKGGLRHPDWLKKKCQEAIQSNNIIGFLTKVARGEDIEQRVNDNGECIKIPAIVKDRMTASGMLLDRGYGKAIQHSEIVNIKFVFEFVSKVTSVLNRVLSDKCPSCGHNLPYRNDTIKEIEILASEQEKVA